LISNLLIVFSERAVNVASQTRSLI